MRKATPGVCISGREIPVFDPENPRPGARATIAVLPLELGRISLPDNERRLTGLVARIADMFTSAITQDLVRDRTFTVLDEKYLGTLDDKRDDIVARVRNGRADMREILKIGRELTADYILVGRSGGIVPSSNGSNSSRFAIPTRRGRRSQSIWNFGSSMSPLERSSGWIVMETSGTRWN